MTPKTRLIALSNRLPVSVSRGPGGEWKVEPGTGGLVTAMAPVLGNRGGLWVGWPGTETDPSLDAVLRSSSRGVGYDLVPVLLQREEVEDYYDGFANQIAWPLFHDLQTRCNFLPRFWYSFLQANMKFAETVNRHSTPSDYLWVHDYHLMGVGRALRHLGNSCRRGFFLHTPFPPLDIFIKLPWRSQVLRNLLEFDLVGFQTMGDRRNFLECLLRLLPGTKAAGRGSTLDVTFEGRKMRVGTFPISIDYDHFVKKAKSEETESNTRRLKERFRGQKIILGVDRMDYTKGLYERLESLRVALLRYPQLRGRITLIQILVPSRRTLREYKILKARTDRLIGEINGQFATMDWSPIHYHYRNLGQEELLSYYRAADVALVTPVKDGMNLVAKEYCACSLDNEGVLILSEFAGAASQFHRHALMVNPYDYEGMADAIYRAVEMERAEKKRRMRRMRENIRRQDIFWWVDAFLQSAFAKNLFDFPPLEEYFPKMHSDSGISGRELTT